MSLILISLILVSAFFVISSRNPIHSVLGLVSVFLFSAFLLVSLRAEFLALSFVIIYVGAIAILFLFIVMMLDIKLGDDSLNTLVYGPLGYFMIFVMILEIVLPFNEACYNLPLFSKVEAPVSFVNWFNVVDGLTNIQLIGQILYTHYFVFFLMAGFILFVAILGSLMLTLTLNKSVTLKHQDVAKQLSRQRDNAFMVYQDTKLS
jgi:NADH-quinone oxidoreductase subunit J